MTMTLCFITFPLVKSKLSILGMFYLFRILSQSIQLSLLQCPLKKRRKTPYLLPIDLLLYTIIIIFVTDVHYYFDSHLFRWIRNMFVSLVEVYSWMPLLIRKKIIYGGFIVYCLLVYWYLFFVVFGTEHRMLIWICTLSHIVILFPIFILQM